MRYRQGSHRTNIRFRFQSLSTNEKIKSRSFRIIAVHLRRCAERCSIPIYREVLRRRSIIAFYMYLRIVRHSSSIPRPIRRNCLIESFTPSQCWIFFGIRQPDLYRLRNVLRFNGVVRLENRCAMDSEEVFLRGLFELRMAHSQYAIAELVFGRDQSQQSRAFTYFVNYIYDTFRYLVKDNLQWWHDKGFIHESHRYINRKLVELGMEALDNQPVTDIFAFIDCNCLETCRVGGGPRSEGADADRWEDLIQRAFYNGWKSVHDNTRRWILLTVLQLICLVLLHLEEMIWCYSEKAI